LAGAATAAEVPELLREESFNYRIVGKLPVGWSRDKAGVLGYTYSAEEIAHAHVRIFRERIKGKLDARRLMEKRMPYYRFPGAEKSGRDELSEATWGGYPAVVFTHAAKLRGVMCLRRVTAMQVGNIWYERIETIYGDTEEDEEYRAGARVFKDGFGILTAPLDEGYEPTPEPETFEDKVLGYRLLKPKSYLRRGVDSTQDPGCRLAFERKGPKGRAYALVRFFEYGPRKKLDFDQWMNIFFGAFAAQHKETGRAQVEPERIPGTKEARAEVFDGDKNGVPVKTLALLLWSDRGRVFCLRITTHAEADELFRESLLKFFEGLTLEP
jgi:hypothetical protein